MGSKEVIATKRTREGMIQLPGHFVSIPGMIQLGDIRLPHENPEGEQINLLANMARACFRHTRLLGKDGNVIVPVKYAPKGTAKRIGLAPNEPHHLHDDAVGSTLFYHALPIYGLTAEYLRFARDEYKKPNEACPQTLSGRVFPQPTQTQEVSDHNNLQNTTGVNSKDQVAGGTGVSWANPDLRKIS